MFDFIDSIYVINLDRRVDRWEKCLEEFRKVGIENRVTRISAFDMPDNPGYGNHLSHARALSDALLNNYKNCLILEDDIEWLDDPLIYLEPTWGELPKDWSILYLGVNTERPCLQISDHIGLLTHAFATHAYVVNRSMYETLITLNTECTNEPNDVRMSREIVPNYKCYTVLPLLAGQRDSYSDIMKKTMSSNEVFITRMKANLVTKRATDKPNFVTFITPSLGRETLLGTVASVLHQSDWNFEHRIVFDGIEPTVYAKDDRLHLIRCSKKGHAGLVRNEAFPFIDTEWISFVDDDDTLHEDAVSILRSESYVRPDIDLFVFTYIDLSNGNTIPRPNSSQDILFGNVGIAFAVKTSFVRKHDIKFRNVACEDYHFVEECISKGAKTYVTNKWTYDVSRRGEWKI